MKRTAAVKRNFCELTLPTVQNNITPHTTHKMQPQNIYLVHAQFGCVGCCLVESQR